MNPIYLRQVAVDNPETRAAIDAAKGGDHDLLLDLFDRNFGPWNRFDENKPFWGDRACPEGAGFYPADMTRDDYEQWLAKPPQDQEAFTSPYTALRRTPAGRLHVGSTANKEKGGQSVS